MPVSATGAMAEVVVTIDTGTTNTRVTVWRGGEAVARAASEVGVRDTSITGSTDSLKRGVAAAIRAALADVDVAAEDVTLFLASGMITSDVGLVQVPHVPAPAGIDDLARAMVQATIADVAPAPIWFVPGVRNDVGEVNLATCEAMDVMRGEEVETFGFLQHLGLRGPVLLILPGSHTKIVHVDADTRITGSMTTLAGELLAVITRQTILAGSLRHSFADVIDEAMAIRGAALAAQVGLSRACFGVRILEQFAGAGPAALASFLAGAVVGTDLVAIVNTAAVPAGRDVPVLVGGTNALARLFALLVRRDARFAGDVTLADAATMRDAAGVGAMAVARARSLIAPSRRCVDGADASHVNEPERGRS